jgi:general secretion pathway protein G
LSSEVWLIIFTPWSGAIAAAQSKGNPMGRPELKRSTARGMTLIEILVVLVLIGIVLGIVGGNFIGKGEKAKADAAKIEIGQIGQTLDLYKLEIGRYPTTQEGMQALISAPPGATNWNGPYWKKSSVPKDPWGNEYKYVSPAQSAPYEIISLGADGKEGGEGPNKDIVSSQQ